MLLVQSVMTDKFNSPVIIIITGSPLPPTSLTFIPSDTSISLMWSHSDECFENCTFMYEVTWQQSRDGSSLRNATTTETSYTIEGLTPGTSYEIGIRSRAYCKENLDVKNMIIQITLDTRKASSPSFTIDSSKYFDFCMCIYVYICYFSCTFIYSFAKFMDSCFWSNHFTTGNKFDYYMCFSCLLLQEEKKRESQF